MPPSLTVQSLADEIIHTRLNNGVKVCLRTIRPTDEERMRNGIAELSSRSRYLRFFSGQAMPPDAVVERLVAVDGHRHLAWGAILTSESEHPAIGAVHVFRRDPQSPAGEFSVAIVDAYHGLGLARILTAVIFINCKIEQIDCLDVHVLHENQPAANFVRSLGGELLRTIDSVSELRIQTDIALDCLRREAREDMSQQGLREVFRQLDRYC